MSHRVDATQIIWASATIVAQGSAGLGSAADVEAEDGLLKRTDVRERIEYWITTRNQCTLDPSLTLTRTQHTAIRGNRGNTRPFTYAVIARLCNLLQRLTAHS
jgi:hypothetical protein